MSWETGPWQILACGEQLCVGQCIQRTSHLIQQLGCRHLPVGACGLGFVGTLDVEPKLRLLVLVVVAWSWGLETRL